MRCRPIHSAERSCQSRARTLWIGILLGLAIVALAPVGSHGLLQIMSRRAQVLGATNPPPNADEMRRVNGQNAQGKNFDAANAERRKQLADDSAKLLKLAVDLKSELDKTSKDTLSLNVIRKADEIEKLARSVKERMKQSVGPS